jgi:hypothetical protein
MHGPFVACIDLAERDRRALVQEVNRRRSILGLSRQRSGSERRDRYAGAVVACVALCRACAILIREKWVPLHKVRWPTSGRPQYILIDAGLIAGPAHKFLVMMKDRVVYKNSVPKKWPRPDDAAAAALVIRLVRERLPCKIPVLLFRDLASSARRHLAPVDADAH